jgi:aspartyl-tRNA(Asn)/glutamyl-tRNA(Gln) amidotransferase subunit B
MSKRNKIAANWIINEFSSVLKARNLTFETNPISPEHISELIDLIIDETINNTIAKKVQNIMFETKQMPLDIVKEHNLYQLDYGATVAIVDKILKQYPKKVEQYRNL